MSDLKPSPCCQCQKKGTAYCPCPLIWMDADELEDTDDN